MRKGLVLGALLAGTGTAQTLVKDIAPGARAFSGLSPTGTVTAGNVAFFAGTSPMASTELWKTDGTAQGTVLLRDIWHGGSSSAPESFTPAGQGRMFFTARSAEGRELWKSDGTPQGTVLVKDIRPHENADPDHLFLAPNGTLFFQADDGLAGMELFRSDGTEAGTVRVADIESGPLSSDPEDFVWFGGALYFTALQANRGRELWKSDGTAQGTVLVREFRPGAAWGVIELFVFGNELWLVADDGTTGMELWKGNGTAASFQLVKDIAPGTGDAWIEHVTQNGGTLFFVANDGQSGKQLWKSDGTTAGTQVVTVIPGGLETFYQGTTPFRNGVLFVARPPATGSELWFSDGTAPGTTMLRDIRPGSTSSVPMNVAVLGNTAVFAADDGQSGRELWKTDGTPAGTVQVADLAPGSASSHPRAMAVLGKRFLFTANLANPVSGQLFETQGTAQTTRRITDLKSLPESSSPQRLTATDSLLFFHANDGQSGKELWRSDGTAQGTWLVKDLAPGPANALVTDMVASGDTLFLNSFMGFFPTGELWKSDGTTAGTQLLHRFPAGTYSPRELVEYRGEIYFRGSDTTNGIELWKSDGTIAGTGIVKDIFPGTGFFGPNSSSPTQLTVFRDRLWFFATDTRGMELHVSDGTAAGTTIFKDLRPDTGVTSIPVIRATRDLLYFVFDDGTHGRELWRTDGTDAGTFLLRNFSDTWTSTTFHDLVPVGDKMFVQLQQAFSHARELWVADRTNGLRLLLVSGNQPGNVMVRWMLPAGDTLFFAGDDVTRGTELWKTDGGTPQRVTDIDPGTGTALTSSFYTPPGRAGSGARVLFAASDGPSGVETWLSDGTAAGSRRLFDLAAGPDSAMPGEFTRVGADVFFAAWRPDVGVELFKLPLSATEGVVAEPFGRGCSGSEGVPEIVWDGLPTLGNASFAIALARARKNSVGLLHIGTGQTRIPVDTCTLYTVPLLLLALPTDAAGEARQPLPIPGDRNLLGLGLTGQWAVFDPNGSFAGTLSYTPGLEIFLGL